MSTMRVYTSEFRESAVSLVLSQGLSIRTAAEELGMPYHTLHSWVRDQRSVLRKTIVKAPPKTMVDAHVRELEAEVRKLTLEKGILKKRRSPPIGLVHHSDRGVQYACHACRDLLEEHGMAQCMSRACNCYDNAMMESLWATLKKELVHDQPFRTHSEVCEGIFEWIEVWYQRIRIHGSLGYVSPEAFEAIERVG
jgi:transposase-like protein